MNIILTMYDIEGLYTQRNDSQFSLSEESALQILHKKEYYALQVQVDAPLHICVKYPYFVCFLHLFLRLELLLLCKIGRLTR
jgi:hypothetical protein